ncbi:hypothetical protein [Oricola cellulosilytica]|uniref:Uncharacterized protein n=1 Tax=Oricola cellulosilytica TaxID=1429082 RepID=A0A4R0PEW9_9HYPH|nr:hypothetical protein [Oricola cellulosilytica]TCD16151.1 hypothetical protein E0D97_01555 [Oricola cellulosilytica]
MIAAATFGPSRADRSPTERADALPFVGALRLPAYCGRELRYVRSDAFGRSVLWVHDAQVYSHLGQPSLSFRFSGRSATRFTARISLCETLPVSGRVHGLRCYLAELTVEHDNVSLPLPVWLAESSPDNPDLHLARSEAEALSLGLIRSELGRCPR